ncbi:MAG: rhodanese-like domain-containing protein [Acidiferrobacterales bacterium]
MSTTKVKSLTPKQAWQLIQEQPNAVLIDVRSEMEFLFVGHPAGAIHVPWIDEPTWKINPNFVTEVRKVILGGVSQEKGGSVPVLLICRSGKRSLEAGEALIKDGMDHIYNIEDGFEGELDNNHHRSTVGGWRHAGLPWEQC